MKKTLLACAFLSLIWVIGRGASAQEKVVLEKVPGGGIQPQAVTDSGGTIHLIYFKGKAAAGDVYYVRRKAGEKAFSRPLRVNSLRGSVMAVGSVRGAHLAVGKGGRIHVAWMGSEAAKDSQGRLPMLYTRLNDQGTSFERERNLIQSAYGLDGGGSVAADGAGNVYVAWHADAGAGEESKRRVWLARSEDDGKTFLKETAVDAKGDGACGCCGLKVMTDRRNGVYLLYRTAKEGRQRDMTLLYSGTKGNGFKSLPVDAWELESCPMTTPNMVPLEEGVLGAWETKGRVLFSTFSPDGMKRKLFSAPGEGENSKHPRLAKNAQGQVLLAWTEGASWGKGGSLAWQVFDQEGRPTRGRGRMEEGVPAWSFASVVGTPQGFLLFY